MDENIEKDENTEMIEFCPKGHVYQHLFEQPKSYSGKPMCDICERTGLSNNCEDGFYHCPICKWDKCLKCKTMPSIMYAIAMDDLAKVQSLSKENNFFIDKKYNDLEGKTIFMKACKNGKLRIVKFLISLGCDMTLKDNCHMTGLSYACACGNLDIVKYLKSIGYDIYEKYINGTTCFHVASRNGRIDVVKYLVSLEWDIHEQNDNGYTAFLNVCLKGNVKMVKYFISLGSKLDEVDNYGNTAFLCTCVSGNLDSVNYLISLGCDIDKRSYFGISGYDYAYKYNTSLAVVLLEYGCEITRFHRSAFNIVKEDLANKIDDRIEIIENSKQSILNIWIDVDRFIIIDIISKFVYGLDNLKRPAIFTGSDPPQTFLIT